MLTFAQFATLYAHFLDSTTNQRDVAQNSGLSLGTVNAAMKAVTEMGLIDETGTITKQGIGALSPYKVDNAIIMAAGLSSRFAPISYEKPKGVLKVRDEVLVERQIRQLQEAGINDITLVVGYKKEEFFYLEDEMNVKIVVNPDYAFRNNNSTIHCVAEKLGNTYICSSDDYFTENPFDQYVYGAYYSAIFADGKTDEYCLQTKGKSNRIVGATIGGENSWVMLGHAYWDNAFSSKFLSILEDVYDKPETAGKLWEDIYIDNINQFEMCMKKYPRGVIWEFDNLNDLRIFDPQFIDNVNSEILDNICEVLMCERQDIVDVVPIKKGLTNFSFKFFVKDKGYVYRHPGDGTDEIINRKAETMSQQIAYKLGLDETFVYENPEKGWKISHYIENCKTLDYHNWNQVSKAMELARTLHQSGCSTEYDYDVFKKACEIVDILSPSHKTSFKDFDEMTKNIEKINRLANTVGAKKCLCHCDFYDPNFLVRDNEIQLIDWEYSGMSDYAVDLGTFIRCCDNYSDEEVNRVLESYYERPLTNEERFHCIAYIALSSYYWFVWALYKDETNDPVGEYLLLWYRSTKRFGKQALDLYQLLIP